MRIIHECLALAVCALLSATQVQAKTTAITRDTLIGARQLAGIEYSAPRGPMMDPRLQAHSNGVINYDRSGWIETRTRILTWERINTAP